MKTRAMMVVAAGIVLMNLGGAAVAGDDRPEFAVRWRSISPAKSEDWDSAGELEAQLRFWNGSPVGVALAIGVGRWDALNDYYGESDVTGSFITEIDGYLTTVPVGASLLHRGRLGPGFDLILEAGLRYVLCDSKITVDTQISDASGNDRYVDSIEMENALVGVLGASLQAEFPSGLAFTLGVGWNGNLIKPEETFLGENIGNTSLSGVSLDIGLAWRF